MEDILLGQIIIVLERQVTDENLRKKIYAELMPTICLIDLEAGDNLEQYDPVFDAAYIEWLEDNT